MNRITWPTRLRRDPPKVPKPGIGLALESPDRHALPAHSFVVRRLGTLLPKEPAWNRGRTRCRRTHRPEVQALKLPWTGRGTPSTHRLSYDLLLAVGGPLTLATLSVAVALYGNSRFATSVLVAGLGAAALVGISLAFRFAARLLRPLRAIARAAEALKNGRLAERAVVYRNDELGRLARSFNTMADRLERREQAATRLHELSHLLQTATDAGEALAIFERLTPLLLPGVSGAIYTISPSRDDIELKIRFGPQVQEYVLQAPPADCWALRQGHCYLVADVERKLVCEHLGGRHGLRDAYACLPLVTQGETIGLLHLSFSAETLEEASLDQRGEELETIATAISLALGNLALREQLKSQSVRDGLTGLYNRRFLEESLPREIERCRRRGLPLTVVMADLDHFKKLNDTWGHEAGDLAIQSFAEAARRHFRSEDLLCRYGGEEFCFVLPECAPEDAYARAEALLEFQRGSRLRFGRDAIGPVTTSIGIATYPDQTVEAGALVRLADAALYRAKLGGRDQLVVHSGGPVAA